MLGVSPPRAVWLCVSFSRCPVCAGTDQGRTSFRGVLKVCTRSLMLGVTRGVSAPRAVWLCVSTSRCVITASPPRRCPVSNQRARSVMRGML